MLHAVCMHCVCTCTYGRTHAGVTYTADSALPAVATTGEVLQEVSDQLALVDLGTLSAGFGCSLAQGMTCFEIWYSMVSYGGMV